MSEILKGAVIIGQSGGPSSVINCSAYGVIKTALESEHITKVYGAHHGIRGVLNDELMIMDEEDPKELENMLHTPSSALGSCRYKIADPDVDDTDYKRILEIFKKYDVRYFFYNGGNDSMDTCNKISKYMNRVGYECRVIGVPKTIDNDLAGTDHCPGFASAAKYIATSVMEVSRDCQVYDTGMITIIECMGRHAGWLTAAAALAGLKGDGPDLVYLPEVDFDMDKFLADVKRIYNEKKNCIVAVSEGVHYADGTFVSEAKTSGTDIAESFMSGKVAVESALAGATDKMVGFACTRDGNGYKCEPKLFDLSLVANTEKKVPLEWINAEGNGVTQGFIDYCLPLIQGETGMTKEDGLPRFVHLKKVFAK